MAESKLKQALNGEKWRFLTPSILLALAIIVPIFSMIILFYITGVRSDIKNMDQRVMSHLTKNGIHEQLAVRMNGIEKTVNINTEDIKKSVPSWFRNANAADEE